MNNSKKIYVYENFSCDEPIFLGTLYVDVIRGGESYSFEYDNDWLKNTTSSIQIDPDLPLYPGRLYPNQNSIFGAFSDAFPDRWGQALMMRKERIIAEKENRKPNKLYNSDFLLGVYDETRMGGLQFKLDQNSEFVSYDSSTPTPPWIALRTLEEAARQFEQDNHFPDIKWLNQLLQPGSSLGGARPKATVMDENGDLWIAKFPSKHDENNTGAWEKVASDLARMCSLDVPPSKIETFSKNGSTFLVKRFDRNNNKRIHFASAMTLLNKTDGASAADGTSYLDIASFIRANGSRPKNDLLELWKRIVFSMAISNTDDHLRNHAFIFEKEGWHLSPMYDVNPVPYGNELSLNVDEYDNRISIPLAISVAPYFDINEAAASAIAKEITDTVCDNWEKLAVKYGISHSQIEAMRPAFSIKSTL